MFKAEILPNVCPVTWSVLRKAAIMAVLATIPAAAVVMTLKTDRLSGDGPSYVLESTEFQPVSQP
jgi:hypothetical protein